MEYDNGDYEVFGGQPLQSARFEKKMSDKFNKILENEGITPIMACKGYWHYPTKVKRKKLAGSVIEVKGDTRLDEFMFLIENYLCYRTNGRGDKIFINGKGNKLASAIKNLYYDMGFVTGRLKKLMDKNNQTWSADNDRSNAHIGNIVLYNGTDKVKLGFVDFDASCDISDFSKSKIKAMQKREYKTIINSANQGAISPRKMQIGFLHRQNAAVRFLDFRTEFIGGFETGYEKEKRTGIKTSEIMKGLDFSRFLEIFNVLRDSDCRLIPEPIRRTTEKIRYKIGGLDDLIYNPFEDYSYNSTKRTEYSFEDNFKDKDIYNILNRNKDYQKGLLSKNS